MATITIQVKGMTCSHCTSSVEEALGALEGVTSVSASLEQGDVTIEYDNQLSQDLVTETIEEIGFEVA